jgi:hypothetical protein
MIKKKGVTVPQKFRLTCARTTYFEIEVSAENIAEAERLFETGLAHNADWNERRLLGRPTHRLVEIAPAQEEAAAGLHDAAA